MIPLGCSFLIESFVSLYKSLCAKLLKISVSLRHLCCYPWHFNNNNSVKSFQCSCAMKPQAHRQFILHNCSHFCPPLLILGPLVNWTQIEMVLFVEWDQGSPGRQSHRDWGIHIESAQMIKNIGTPLLHNGFTRFSLYL